MGKGCLQMKFQIHNGYCVQNYSVASLKPYTVKPVSVLNGHPWGMAN